MARAGLVGIVSGLIIGAAIFIYVASILLNNLRTSFTASAFAGRAAGDLGDIPNLTARYNTSASNMITMSFTIGTLMAVAAIAVVGFWIVKSVIGGT